MNLGDWNNCEGFMSNHIVANWFVSVKKLHEMLVVKLVKIANS